jgi:acyl carrier protein
MGKENVMKILRNTLASYGIASDEDIALLDSVSYMSLLVDVENSFGTEIPDEFLTENLFADLEKFAGIIESIL